MVPLKDLHFTKRQPWFSGCWNGTLAFPEGGIKIAGLKFKTLPEMKAYFRAKYLPLQEQWQKDMAAWKEQNPKPKKAKPAASSGDAGPKDKKQKVDGSNSSTPSSASRPASSGDATPRKKQKVDGSASSTPATAPATGGSSKSRCPPLFEAAEEFKRQLNVTGNLTEVVDAACEALGVSSDGNVTEKAARCWKMIQG